MKDTFKNKKLSDKDIEKVSGGENKENKYHYGTYIVICISCDYEEEFISSEVAHVFLEMRNYTCEKCGGNLKGLPNY